MNKLTLSEINVVPVKFNNGLVAFASCVVNNQFFIGNIAIYTSPASPDGFRLVYANKILKNGIKLDIVHPIKKEVGLEIQKQIVGCYLKLIENLAEKGGRNERNERYSQ